MGAPQDSDISPQDVKWDTFDTYSARAANGLTWEVYISEDGGELDIIDTNFSGKSVSHSTFADWQDVVFFVCEFHDSIVLNLSQAAQEATPEAFTVTNAWIEALRVESMTRDLAELKGDPAMAGFAGIIEALGLTPENFKVLNDVG